jgi:FtsP/CotA-like multicopper oxidase with cupredoxin domain
VLFGSGLPALNRRQFVTAALSFGLSGTGKSQSRDQKLVLEISPTSLEIAPNRFVQTNSYTGYDNGQPICLAANTPTQVSIVNRTLKQEFVHWHGLEVPAALDGTPEEESLSVGREKNLAYTLPPQSPGLFFVHSHAMAMHDLTSGPYSGQFAPIVIGRLSSPILYDREFFITTHEWFPTLIDTASDDRSLDAMRHLRTDPDDDEGDGMPDGGWDVIYGAATINGHVLGAGAPLRVRAGERILFRIVNASATEPLQLYLPAHRFLVLALDGYAVPVPAQVEVLTLGVGERIDAVVAMDMPGVWVLGSPNDRARGLGMGIVVEYANRAGNPIWSSPETTAPWNYALFASSSDSTLSPDNSMTLRLERRPAGRDGFERWAITSDALSSTELHRNQRTRITLMNASDEPHPMHLHRLPFDLISVAGMNCMGIRKDTVVVPPFQEVQLDVDPGGLLDSGPALLHCHNQMHMDCGLKTVLHIP